MDELLNNPVFNALLTGEANLANGTDKVKYFDEEVSPFVGFPDDYSHGFNDLYEMLPENRGILYATRKKISLPIGWELLQEVEGTQFVFTGSAIMKPSIDLAPLEIKHVDEMIALAKLTRPGPFSKRTIEFGHYYGVFQDNKLVAMAGQRLHVGNYTEISAVCTHPDWLGRGYAAALIQQQLFLIAESGQIPFLHVRADNDRAIALYERLGFEKNGPMNFYFLRRG